MRSRKSIELFQAIRSHHRQQHSEEQKLKKQLAQQFGLSPIQAGHLIEAYRTDPTHLSAEIENVLNRNNR